MTSVSKLLAEHRVSQLGAPQQSTDRVGYCIYCLVAFPDDQLSDEHVIADGLGGYLKLKKSSCEQCRKIVEGFEEQLMRSTIRDYRGATGMRSRKRKKRPPPQQPLIGNDGRDFQAAFSADSPWILVQPVLGDGPGIYSKDPRNNWSPVFAQALCKDDTWEKIGSLGARDMASFGFCADVWFKSVAKTALSFAVSELISTPFHPLIATWIIGRSDRPASFWIGSDGPFPPEEDYHQLRLFEDIFWDDRLKRFANYYRVEVRLISNALSYKYHVVVGLKY